MLKHHHHHHHHHNGVPVSTSHRRRRSHLHQTSSRSAPEVGIIPGNRFFLLPLKKVTALVRRHTPCREPSATTTKPCIVSKPKPKQACSPRAEIHRESLLQEFNVRSQAHSTSSRVIAKQRRRRSFVAKTPLSPVCEQASVSAEQELLLEYERLLWNDGRLVDTRNCRTVGVSNRSRAIFTWGETTLLESCRGASLAPSSTQMLQELNLNTATKTKKKRSNSFSDASDIDLGLYRSSRKAHTKSRFSVSPSTERECVASGGRSFGRNNRVSPSSLSHSGQQLHPEFGTRNDSATSFGKGDDLETPRSKNYRSCNSRATSFGKADELETPRNKNYRSCNSRATSFGKGGDLETPRNKNFSCNSRATSFGKGGELETPRNKNRSHFRATSFSKAAELVTPRNKNRSKSMGSITTSTKVDELVAELETPWKKDSLSNFRDNCTTSFSKAEELETLCDQNRSNLRGNCTTSSDKGDEIVKPCDKNRRKARSHHRRISFGKADELLIRDKKRRIFSLGGCSHQIRSCSPFLCSFTNKKDLPVSPSPLRLSRRLQSKASVAQGEVV